MQQGYNDVARSIASLTYQQRIRTIREINEDIIDTAINLNQVTENDGNESLLRVYTQKIDDVEKERTRAERFDDHINSAIGIEEGGDMMNYE